MQSFLMPTLEEEISRMANRIYNANGHVVVLTGAGISVNSGIPDFRGKSKDSFYNKYPTNILSLDSFKKNRKEFVEAFLDKFGTIRKAEPNKSHDILVDWENKGIIKGVITQNVDGLHRNENLIEVHGNAKQLRKVQFRGNKIIYTDDCVDFDSVSIEDAIDLMINHDYKPDIVLFGEDVKHFRKAREWVSRNHITLIIGTRMEVYPFSNLPEYNKSKTRKIIIVNNENIEREYLRNTKLIGDATEILSNIDETIKILRGGNL